MANFGPTKTTVIVEVLVGQDPNRRPGKLSMSFATNTRGTRTVIYEITWKPFDVPIRTVATNMYASKVRGLWKPAWNGAENFERGCNNARIFCGLDSAEIKKKILEAIGG